MVLAHAQQRPPTSNQTTTATMISTSIIRSTQIGKLTPRPRIDSGRGRQFTNCDGSSVMSPEIVDCAARSSARRQLLD